MVSNGLLGLLLEVAGRPPAAELQSCATVRHMSIRISNMFDLGDVLETQHTSRSYVHRW